jgi:hypothetical protein
MMTIPIKMPPFNSGVMDDGFNDLCTSQDDNSDDQSFSTQGLNDLMTILMMNQVILNVMMIQQMMLLFLNVVAMTIDIMIIQVLLQELTTFVKKGTVLL